MPFVPPKMMRLANASVEWAIGSSAPRDVRGVSDGVFDRVPIVLTSSAPALYVTLTTAVAGQFSENVILLRARQPRTVLFMTWESHPTGAELVNALRATIRVEHAQPHQRPHAPAAVDVKIGVDGTEELRLEPQLVPGL